MALVELLIVGGVATVVYGYDYLKSTVMKTPDENDIMTHKELNTLKGNGVILTKNVRLSEEQSNKHQLLIGPTGSKKSRTVIMPNLAKAENCSIVCIDPSSELEQETGMALFRNGYSVKRFSFEDVENSVGFDPLANCENVDDVCKWMEVLLGTAYESYGSCDNNLGEFQTWIQRTAPLLKAFAIYNFYTKKYTFDEMIMRLMTERFLFKEVPRHLIPKEVLERGSTLQASSSIELEILNSGVKEAIDMFNSFATIRGAETTVDCVRNVITTAFQIFHESKVKAICRKKSIDFKQLRKTKTCLFLQVPENKSTHYAPFVSVLLQQLTETLIDNHKGLRIQMYLDEFANIGKIPNICTTLTTCRKRNIGIMCCIQSINQLEMYGVNYKVLKEIFDSIIAMRGLKDSADYIAQLVGDKRVKNNSDTTVKSLVITPDEIKRIADNQAILIVSNKRAVLDETLPYFSRRDVHA